MRVQSVNNRQNCGKVPSFEAVEVKFVDNQVKPLAKMFQEAYDNVQLSTKNKKFNPSIFMESFAKRLSKFLEKKGISDGKIRIARAYGQGVKENSLNVTFELGEKHIEGPACVSIEDLFQGKNRMSFKPLIDSLNQNYPYTTVRWFSSTENPFREFDTRNYTNNNKVKVAHQEIASHMSLGHLDTGFGERFK